MNPARIGASALVLSLIGAAGCASAGPPQELLNARTAYDRASHGNAGTYNPADVYVAKASLDTAEQSFQQDGDSQQTRDLAYTAERRAEIAEARADAAQSTQSKQQTMAQIQANQAQQVQLTSAQLTAAKQQLSAQGQSLQDERTRREQAEKSAAQAAADLARIASVKQEPRGMVITLSGSVLFASAKYDLLPQAQAKLSEVANTLSKQDPDAKIVVQGYTDSQGGQSYNEILSQHRAEAVRTYLVGHGIASDRITAQGLGPANPVADNASAEGRADNRRVEIVVQNGGGNSDSTPSTTK